MSIRAVIFDLDGTLLNTLGDIRDALNVALEHAGFAPVSLEDCRSRVGWGIKPLIELSLDASGAAEPPPELVRRIGQDFLDAYRANPVVHTVPYPGIQQLLSDLREANIKTAVLTNKPDELAQLVVERAFPEHRFERVLGGRPDQPHKPDPTTTEEILREIGVSPEETLFVGDSDVDIETARNARCVPVGVSWGFRDVELLREAGAEYIWYSTDDARALLGLDPPRPVSPPGPVSPTGTV